ncbi:MAG: hypothetical protein K0S65_1962, partial [Labilithrix sp.]|nr:hypothetical protein [Labilithrix sp.]
ASFAFVRGLKGGEGWVELQVAQANDGPGRTRFSRWDPDARFVSIEAMTLLHDAFGRASPGFDLFLPRLLDAPALGRLERELGTLKAQLLVLPNAAAAKARFGELSPRVAALPDDVAWLSARSDLVGTVEGLAALAADLGSKGQGLWVLGI